MKVFSKRRWSKKIKVAAAVGVVLLFWFVFALPGKLFQKPTSFVLQDRNGNLLSASIAADGQWRFPYDADVPDKFVQCITTFEDKRFFYHPGVDLLALGRATVQNIRRHRVVSGGSTLSMQVIRLSQNESRTIWQKIAETILAVRLECSYRKRTIMALYASNAPFGSNVVGLDAASWRYYNRSPDKLSWGEMAALAVLPNAPTLVHPGKNRSALLRKRNRLLDQLVTAKVIDQSMAALAKLEPLPGQPLPLPQLAPHLLDRYKKDFNRNSGADQSTRITTTLDLQLQQQVTQVLTAYHNNFKGNGINNAAAIVTEVETGNVVAYVGNIYDPADAELESHVDVISSLRSPGSTLKPLLYAAMQSDGLVLPRQLVPDIPTQIGGYSPQNFNHQFDGAVPAHLALSRSLNIPAIRMLQQYKYQRFYGLLQQCGITTLSQPADHYGLSLILGGCEVTAWDMAGLYSSLARTYQHQDDNSGILNTRYFHPPVYVPGATPADTKTKALPLDYTSLWHMFNAMQEVMRPGEEGLWNLFNSAQRIAWKTGTSFGFRDGWAVGVTPKYCVVVWVGNTDGEGRPDLTGINTAAPVLFDIFRLLPVSVWFKPPVYDYVYLPICHESGYKASANCLRVDTMLVSSRSANAGLCPYHRLVHLDHTGTFRVSESCEAPSAMVHKSWFVLPPAIEYYYKSKHQDYLPLPPYKPGCQPAGLRQMDLIYPDEDARIYVPVEITGQQGKTIFTATHTNPHAKLFWHLDDQFVGTTTRFHQMALSPAKGMHHITIVDEQGETITRRFEILDAASER